MFRSFISAWTGELPPTRLFRIRAFYVEKDHLRTLMGEQYTDAQTLEDCCDSVDCNLATTRKYWPDVKLTQIVVEQPEAHPEEIDKLLERVRRRYPGVCVWFRDDRDDRDEDVITCKEM